MWALLRTFSWQELRHHPWRNAAAVVAVMLGVALAFSVHLINASALDEFSTAVRSVNGQPDLELRAATGSFDEAVFAQVVQHPQVLLASPVLELGTMAAADATGARTAWANSSSAELLMSCTANASATPSITATTAAALRQGWWRSSCQEKVVRRANI